jgi:branched-chain amino acid transport system permease protein
MQTLLGLLVDAFAYGMVLFIISIGLSVMMGLMRIINLAHGAFAMIGGYLAAFLAPHLGFAPALLLAVTGAVLVALPLERLLYRRLYGVADPLIHVLMTIGITLVVIGTVNYLFGPTIKTIPLPEVLRGPANIAGHTMPAHRLFAIVSGMTIALALWLLIEKTAFGTRLRAAVDNAGMAAALGVRTERLYAAIFVIAVALGAFGGIVGAELMPIEPYYALRYMVTFLVIVSVGGAGSIAGALAASLALGFVDTTSRYFIPNLGEFCFYLAVILIVLVFPSGLFGRAHRA